MKIVRNAISSFGFGPHRAIFRKTIGDSLKDGKRSAVNEVLNDVLWAGMVLGDFLFPSLRGRRIFGRIHAGGLIVILTASFVPIMLTYRLWHRFVNHESGIAGQNRENGHSNQNNQNNRSARQRQPDGGAYGR